jgi:putative Mg2+ transporter-C (MgtC) family protein
MSLEVTWQAIAFRILLTLIAGAMLGLNRSRHGNSAGLRTTMLVTLAASIAMIQMNLLISTNGRPHDSYASMDVMRLPLGILTGVGFIGAGAILRKDNMVVGVTTAATMWFATMVGLCMGIGQLILGSVAGVLGFFILSTLHMVEAKLNEQQKASLRLILVEDSLSEAELRTMLESAKVHIHSVSIIRQMHKHQEQFKCDVRWPSHKDSMENPAVLKEIARLPGLVEMEWLPEGTPLR